MPYAQCPTPQAPSLSNNCRQANRESRSLLKLTFYQNAIVPEQSFWGSQRLDRRGNLSRHSSLTSSTRLLTGCLRYNIIAFLGNQQPDIRYLCPLGTHLLAPPQFPLAIVDQERECRRVYRDHPNPRDITCQPPVPFPKL
jgi:hypothetical protein